MIFASFPKSIFGWMFSGAFENDFALLQACNNSLLDYRVALGYNGVLASKGVTIYHNISNLYREHDGKDYAESLFTIQQQWVKNGNKIMPYEYDSKYWENKIYMQQKFIELGISHPKTIIVDVLNKAPNYPSIEFPLLFKPAHASGSTGIIKLNNLEDYHHVISTTTQTEYLIQEWIDMRRDLRLIYIGDELVLHYWRINHGKEWIPTSTGHGSSVDFESLPTQWMDFIFAEYKKLNIKTGAFDITWRNDDLSTTPLILEVSPSYMPNPAPSGVYKNRSYSDFKKNIWGENAYYKKYIDLVFDLKIKLVKEYDNH